MKSRELIACFVLVHGSLFGGGHALAQGFNRRYDLLGQSLYEVGFSIERIQEHYMVVGALDCVTSDNVYYNPLVFSVQLDAQSSILTSDTIVYPAHAIYPGAWNCTAQRSDGGFVAGGGTVSQTETNRHALWLFDPDGSITLAAEYGDEGAFNTSRQAIECKNGDFLLVGETDVNGPSDATLIRTDVNGDVLWSRTYGGELQDRGWYVDTTAGEGFFMGGQHGYTLNGPYGKQWVLRVDALGDTVWQRIWGGEFGHELARLTTKANGNPVISGGTWLPDNVVRFCYMAELDATNGELLWERHYDNLGDDMTLLIGKEVMPDAGHIACGYLVDTQDGSYNGIMLRTADNGDSLWMRTFVYQDTIMSNGQGVLNDVVPTLDGGFIACGTAYNEPGTQYPPGYSQDVWVVKVDSLGCIIPGCAGSTSITTQITNMGYALKLYPNPLLASNGQVQLHVAIDLPTNFKTEGPLVISVTSAEGKLEKQEQVPASLYGELVLDLQGLAAGTYSLHLTDAHTWIAGKTFVVQ